MAKGWTTYQSLIDAKMAVTAFCNNPACRHKQVLDLVKLRDRFGPDAPAMKWDIRPKLRCKKMQQQRRRPDLYARHWPERLRQCQGRAITKFYAPVSERFGTKSATIADLPASVLNALSRLRPLEPNA